MVPNNPYKSPQADYYDQVGLATGAPAGGRKAAQVVADKLVGHHSGSELLHDPMEAMASVHSNVVPSYKTYLKPIIKTGALLTSLALFGKKVLEKPVGLNPTGMILQGVQP